MFIIYSSTEIWSVARLRLLCAGLGASPSSRAFLQMAPKPTPLGSSATAASKKASGAKGQTSNRGAPSSTRKAPQDSARKKGASTAQKLDKIDEMKKKKAKELAEAKVPEPVPEVPELSNALEPIAKVIAPVQALIKDLDEKVTEIDARILKLSTPDGSTDAKAAGAAEAETEDRTKDKKSVQRVWRGLADEKLTEMASSLDGALMNESKLKDLFDKMDLDKSGAIDKDELRIALKSIGKEFTDDQLERMMKATDDDSNGEIDFQEFVGILKMNSAAKVIQSRARATSAQKKSNPAAAAGSGGGGRPKPSAGAVQFLKVNKDQLARMLGDAIASKSTDIKEIVRAWDRKGKGSLNKVEFRVGVREELGLNADNAVIDEFFGQFDEDGGGTIDIPELRDALDWLQQRAKKDREEREGCEQKLAQVKAKRQMLQDTIDAAASATQAALDAVDALTAHRALRHIDAKLGVKVQSKLKSDSNEKGLSIEDMVAKWDTQNSKPGVMNKQEFTTKAAAALADMTLKRHKATQGGGAAATAPAAAPVADGGVSTAELEGVFDKFAAALSDDGSPKEEVGVKDALDAMLNAETARKSKDAELHAAAESLKKAAIKEQQHVGTVKEKFVAQEAQEDAIATAKAERQAKAAAEAKTAEAAAKKAALEAKKEAAQKAAAAQKDLPKWMSGEGGTRNGNAAAATSSAAGAPTPAVDVTDAIAPAAAALAPAAAPGDAPGMW